MIAITIRELGTAVIIIYLIILKMSHYFFIVMIKKINSVETIFIYFIFKRIILL